MAAEEGLASIPVANIQRKRPPGLESTRGYLSSKSHNSSRVRSFFAVFTSSNSHSEKVRARRLSIRALILQAAMLHRFALHKEMIRYFRQVQDALIEWSGIPCCFAPNCRDAKFIGKPDK